MIVWLPREVGPSLLFFPEIMNVDRSVAKTPISRLQSSSVPKDGRYS